MSTQANFSTGSNIVSLSNVSHCYKQTRALDDISLSIPSGIIVGIIGPDGVGKSSLLGLIAGVKKVQSGKVEVLSGDIARASHRKEVGPRIAFMPQGLGKNLYTELSVEENLHFFGRLFGQTLSERLSRIETLTKATGLDSFRDRPAGKLSGGMKQKLGLCCSLIHDPDLLILDEPTTGVDPLSRRQFWLLIKTIRQQRPTMSVLVSTAYMDEAEQFDWLIAMNNGKVLATGSPAQIKENAQTSQLETAYISLLPKTQKNAVSTLDIPPRQTSNTSIAILAKKLTRKFGQFTAVDSVDFEIEAGEIFGFLGSNGCGKTTTMKILTGLLPPSEGEIQLFGQPIDNNDFLIRNRIGFMSQGFSLYSEMTVLQNLTLHARLFHLSDEKRQSRIDTLVKRFHLESALHKLSGDLPLGLRQRLSLAVALIHEPEILILDEPTSGVDPVARDNFWRVLVDLSRNEGVTIFISTHFMNEALRCDRISLMHAGKVLAQDTPNKLIEQANTDNLEDAFIHYMESAVTDTKTSKPKEDILIKSNDAVEDEEQTNQLLPKSYTSLFDWRRIAAYSIRETLEVLRDPVRLAFAFIGSLLLLFIFTYGISTDVDNIKFASFDQDHSPASRGYFKGFESSTYFTERLPIGSASELESRLIRRDIEVGIEIPPNFGSDLKKGHPVTVSAWIDGANTFRAGTVEGYVNGAHASYLMANLAIEQASLFNIEPRFRYNPTLENIYAMAPAIPAMLLILFPSILMAVSVAREKEIGTVTNFYVTPTSRLEYVLGKQLPYIGIAFANFLMLMTFVVLVMGVPIKGSIISLILGGLLYVTATTSLGFLIASFVKSQVAAVFITAVLTMMPTMQFSGMMQPVSTLDDTGRMIGSFWPTTYFMHLSVGSFTKGLNFTELSADLKALLLFIPAFIGLSVLLLKKQEV